MIKQIIFIGSTKYFLHCCSCCGKEWIEPAQIKTESKKPTTPPYNYCSLCGKWLGFFSYLQFWKPKKLCSECKTFLV